MPARPARIARAGVRTHCTARGSASVKKHQAAFHTYSRAWMKSTTTGTATLRARASARMRSIWWVLPSTRATQVRLWSGSRRSASSNPAAITSLASSVTDAESHLPVAAGASRAARRSSSPSGRMSATVAQTRNFLDVMRHEVGAVHRRGGTLKEAFGAAHAALAPVYGGWPIFEHCLPFDVSRLWDELDGIDWPRIWTAQRDREVWDALQD